MTTRRRFLLQAAAAVPGLVGGRRPAPRVEATPTVFHGHPEGQSTLVRFTVTGVDAPAARLRVFGARGRLVGTAGLVRRDGLLVGELLVPLTAPTTLRSELETPVTRGVRRTTHRLAPTPRWTIRWLTLADPDALRRRLEAVAPLLLGAEVAVLDSAGVRLNPWPASSGDRDHLDLLRIAVPAMRLSAATGIPVSQRALAPDAEPVTPEVQEALRASGIPELVTDRAGADPAALGFDAGRARMASLIEPWLAAQPAPRDGRGSVTLIGTDPDLAVRALRSIEEWNGRYAYPRLELPPAAPTPAGPAVADRRGDETSPFGPALRLAAPGEPTPEGLARRLALPAPGIVVFNPSPFGRSGVVELPDGVLRLITDVPGLGYAYEPARAAAAPVREPFRQAPVETARFVVRLNHLTGAIQRAEDRDAGVELVSLPQEAAGTGDGGLNALPGATLSDAWVEPHPGVGIRVVARRAASGRECTSRVTVYDALPWLDIENRWDAAPPHGLEWRFDLAPATDVTWERPGGSERAAPPVERVRVLRWVALAGPGGTTLLASDRPAELDVSPDGRVTLRGPGSRFRIARHTGVLLPDDPWRFGWGIAPFVAGATPGSGPLRLPTFGRLLDVADPMTALLTVKDADDGVGIVAYLMDLGGPPRQVAVRPGLLGFESGLALDLTERDRVPLERTPDGGVLVRLEAGGYAAVRLVGVRLAG